MTDEPMGMTDAERLAQRFIDQELSAEERVGLLARIGRDEALRGQLLSLERLALDVSRLPRPFVPEGFVDQVLRRTELDSGSCLAEAEEPHRQVEARESTAGRAASWLWTPRVLRWNMASAVALAAAVTLIVAAAVVTGRSWRSGSDRTAVAVAPTLRSPTMLVRLIVMQPNAKTVAVAGDFNGWNPARTPLERVSGDAWAVTIPLQAGRYEYMFVVNGEQWLADPFATERRDDGFGSQNAVLEVRPEVTPL